MFYIEPAVREFRFNFTPTGLHNTIDDGYKGIVDCRGRVAPNTVSGIRRISLMNSRWQGNGSSSWIIREKRGGPRLKFVGILKNEKNGKENQK